MEDKLQSIVILVLIILVPTFSFLFSSGLDIRAKLKSILNRLF